MKLFNLHSSVFIVAAFTLVSRSQAVVVEDRLVSARHAKRDANASVSTYPITFYHINDVHAHLDEFRTSGQDCTNPTAQGCVGGYARVKAFIDGVRPTKQNSLFLNAGDEFQGTAYYTYYGGEKIAETLNQVGFDGMTLGNHEFDGGDDQLGAFLQNLTFPVLVANMVSTHPVLSKIQPYHIYEKYNVAVIGVITPDTATLSRPGSGTRFTDPVAAVQRTINHIKATSNVNRIVALTHIGYGRDIDLARRTRGLSLIMGGHSHTLIGSMNGASGSYPTIAKDLDGEEVFVVTAFKWGEYVGYIDINFDESGRVTEYRGAPVRLTQDQPTNSHLKAQIKTWAIPFQKLNSEIVGSTSTFLSNNCQWSECTLGNVLTDAMLARGREVSSGLAGAIVNAGSIRTSLNVGNVSRGDILTVAPFGNTLVIVELTGKQIWDVIEAATSRYSPLNGRYVSSGIQVSGIRYRFDPSSPNGRKVKTIQLGGPDAYRPIDKAATYSIAISDYMAAGGDNLLNAVSSPTTLETQTDLLAAYFLRESPVNMTLQARFGNLDLTIPPLTTTSTTSTTSSSFTTSTISTTSTTSTTSSTSSTSSSFFSSTFSTVSSTPRPTIVSPTCNESNGTTFSTKAGRSYVIECQLDRFGNDLKMVHIRSNTIEGCLTACDSTTGCVGISMSGTACYMKKGQGKGIAASHVRGARLLL